MIVDINKKYKSINGSNVTIFEIDESQAEHAVFGIIILDDGCKIPAAWTIKGRHDSFKCYDLVELPTFSITKSANDNKIIKYFGTQLLIPTEHKFVATNKNGKIYSYLLKPELGKLSGYWQLTGGNKAQYHNTVEFDGDWTQSLIQYGY